MKITIISPVFLAAGVLTFTPGCNSSGGSNSAITSATVTLKGGLPARRIRAAVSPFSGVGDTDASQMTFTVYKFAVSSSVDCSSPITIFNEPAGVPQDVTTGPTFGHGTLDTGTYPCVMVEVSKVITVAAAVAHNDCTTTAPFQDLICADGQFSQQIDGSAVPCSGDVGNDQHVTLFITTVSAGTSGGRSLLPPTDVTDTTSGIKLTAPFVVSGDATGTFTVDNTNFLDSNSGCSTHAPTFGFN